MKTAELISKLNLLSWVTNEITKEFDVIITFPALDGSQSEATVLGVVDSLKEILEKEQEPRGVFWKEFPGTKKEKERGYVFGLVDKMKGDYNYLLKFVEKSQLFNGENVKGISYKWRKH